MIYKKLSWLDSQPEGLVLVRYSFIAEKSSQTRPSSHALVVQETVPLDADVPANGSLSVSPIIRGPEWPGSYTLRIELVQRLGGRDTTLPISPAQCRVVVLPLTFE